MFTPGSHIPSEQNPLWCREDGTQGVCPTLRKGKDSGCPKGNMVADPFPCPSPAPSKPLLMSVHTVCQLDNKGHYPPHRPQESNTVFQTLESQCDWNREGKRNKIKLESKAKARPRNALPATTDFWINAKDKTSNNNKKTQKFKIQK